MCGDGFLISTWLMRSEIKRLISVGSIFYPKMSALIA